MKQPSEFKLKKPEADEEWQEYHRIKKAEIVDRLNLVYDYNHYMLSDPNNHHFCFYKNNQIIGVLHIQFLDMQRGAIRGIAIDKNQKNKGYGSILLKLAEKEFQKLGVSAVHLHANPKAYNFYTRNGYSKMEFKNDKSISPETIDMGKIL